MKPSMQKISVLLAVTALLTGSAVAQDEPIVLGIPIGLSGANSITAPAVIQATELAVSEINDAGGVLGRKLVIELADSASSAAGAQKAYDSLVYQKKVDVIISSEPSAARNAGLPIITRGKIPYIYTSFYEGGSCNKYQHINAWVPQQVVSLMVDYFMKDLGAKTFFLVGNDYAFGRGLLGDTNNYVTEKGGMVVGEEYNPIDASDWTATVSKIREANPDVIITSTAAGAPNVTFTKQLRAAGITANYGSYALDEGTAKTLGSDGEGIYLGGTYYTGINSEKNAQFLKALNDKFGAETKTSSELSVPNYDAVHLYALAVAKAGTVDTDAVVKALSEVSFDGPRGPIQMSKQRHAPLTMYLAQVNAQGDTTIIKSQPNVDPGEQCPNL
ncbi:substrate-binding protein [Mesorhizobium australicum]|uniref:Amino acid/amide ABC transporter substrate-binding protein, HAAT family n=1 Tax=Mesorhizobium australicum TaxID=536018 RepID=A0A1X7MR36_9HYPH|nr:amino acid/amide ABC transporter substrate-binding protein, HAAT family [Mesorhizobium australicum]